jgi:hypothetical protein
MIFQVTGIRRFNEPDERRSFSLSPLKGKMLPGEMLLASRADIVYMRDGEALKVEEKAEESKTNDYQQLDLF